MPESGINTIEENIETRRRLRKQVKGFFPEAEKVLSKSGIRPPIPSDNNEPETDEIIESRKKYGRARINIAGQLVREQLKSETDGLTGISNRDGFIRRGAEELERAKRSGNKVAVVVLDLNNLKIINDSQGHDEGDKLLINVAGCLQQGTRKTDVTSRWGGDEYGVVLENTDYDGVELWWNRLDKLFIEKGLAIGGGVVIVDPNDLDEHGDWGQQFIKYRDLADRPLTDAKNQTKLQGTNILLRYDKWLEAQSTSKLS